MRHDHDYWRRLDGTLRCECGEIRGKEAPVGHKDPVKVTVYTKPNCQPCRATKRYLSERQIQFEVADITEPMNTAAAKALGHLEAPVVVVATNGRPGSEVSWSGHRPDMLERLVAGTLGADTKAVA